MKRIALMGILILNLFWQACFTVRKSYDTSPGPCYSGQYASVSPVFTGTMRAVSYNIHWAKELETAIEELKQNESAHQADVILLQETHAGAAEVMSRSLGYNYVFYPPAMYRTDDLEFGNAVLSRWPILDHWKIVLPHENPTRRMFRIAVLAVLDVDGRQVLTGSVHTHTLMYGNEVRLDQVKHLVDNLDPSFELGIIGGDFNTDSDYIIREMELIFRRAGFIRATCDIGPTLKKDALGILALELDHIFVKGMQVISAGTMKNARASDHLPVWIQVKFMP